MPKRIFIIPIPGIEKPVIFLKIASNRKKINERKKKYKNPETRVVPPKRIHYADGKKHYTKYPTDYIQNN